MVVKVEARSSASGCSAEPSMGRSWHMEIPETGHLELSVRVHAEDAVDPEEVDTLLTPETKRRRRELSLPQRTTLVRKPHHRATPWVTNR